MAQDKELTQEDLITMIRDGLAKELAGLVPDRSDLVLKYVRELFESFIRDIDKVLGEDSDDDHDKE
jgi:hypothetical protein